VLFWRLTHEGVSVLEERRPLDDAHFDFRGGWARGMAALRTRVNDSDPSAPRTRRGTAR
jgi:hypothetical protein